MRASIVVAFGAFVVGSSGAVAFADETAANPAKSPAKGSVVIKVDIAARRPIPRSVVDIAKRVTQVPLPDLRRPLVDPNGNVLDRDPF